MVGQGQIKHFARDRVEWRKSAVWGGSPDTDIADAGAMQQQSSCVRIGNVHEGRAPGRGLGKRRLAIQVADQLVDLRGHV